jgi:23S rRNA A1618 N6-methylase RlmF
VPQARRLLIAASTSLICSSALSLVLVRSKPSGLQGYTERTATMKRTGATSLWAVPSPAPSYDFGALAALSPALRAHMRPGTDSIDFSRPGATLALSVAILRHRHNLSLTVPPGHLVPTVPARHQYLAWAHGLLSPEARSGGQTLLDIGTGPSAIYSLLACRTLPSSWRVVATDVDPDAVSFAHKNVADNGLTARVSVLLRRETDPLIPGAPYFPPDCPLRLTVCNPPWYDLDKVPDVRPPPGTPAQLETAGGERQFLSKLALESRGTPDIWFTSLVGIKADLPKIVGDLRGPRVRAVQVVTTELSPGGRTTRWAVAWRFGTQCSVVNAVYPSRPPATKAPALRVTLVVTPGARHAGTLSVMHIFDVLLVALAEDQWEADNDSRREACGPLAVLDCHGGKLLLSVTNGKRVGAFDILVKVESRGARKHINIDGVNGVVDLLVPRLVAHLDSPERAESGPFD